jgi:hypothetical protein
MWQLASAPKPRCWDTVLVGLHVAHILLPRICGERCVLMKMRCTQQVIYDDDLLSYISETDYTEMQHSVVWPEPDPVLQEQLQRANAEKLAAEEQRQAAEAAVAEQEQVFAQACEALQSQLCDLTEGIKGKEAVIAQLVAAEADARAQSEQLLERMQKLELDIDSKQASCLPAPAWHACGRDSHPYCGCTLCSVTSSSTTVGAAWVHAAPCCLHMVLSTVASECARYM